MRQNSVHAHKMASSISRSKVRSIGLPSGTDLRQPSSSYAAVRGSPSPPKNGGFEALCQQAHPIGTWYPQHWHTCQFCPPSLRQMPNLWHLDQETGKMQPPGWLANQEALLEARNYGTVCVTKGVKTKIGKKRSHSVCSLVKRIKSWCFPQPPPTANIVFIKEQSEGEEDMEVKGPHSQEPMSTRQSSSPPSLANNSLVTASSDMVEKPAIGRSLPEQPESGFVNENRRLTEEITSLKNQLQQSTRIVPKALVDQSIVDCLKSQLENKESTILSITTQVDQLRTVVGLLKTENEALRSEIGSKDYEVLRLNELLSQQANVAEFARAEKFTNFRHRSSSISDIEDDLIDRFLLLSDDDGMAKSADNCSDSMDVLTSTFANLYISNTKEVVEDTSLTVAVSGRRSTDPDSPSGTDGPGLPRSYPTIEENVEEAEFMDTDDEEAARIEFHFQPDSDLDEEEAAAEFRAHLLWLQELHQAENEEEEEELGERESDLDITDLVLSDWESENSSHMDSDSNESVVENPARPLLLTPIRTVPSSPLPFRINLDLIWMGRSALLRLCHDDISSIPRRLLIGISNGMPRQQVASHLEVLLVCLRKTLETYRLNLEDVISIDRSIASTRRFHTVATNQAAPLNFVTLKHLLRRIMNVMHRLE